MGRPFPARQRAVVARKSIFNPVATFANYVGYVRKDCQFSQHTPGVETPDVAIMVAAMTLDGGAGTVRRRNHIPIGILNKIVIRESRGGGECAHLPFLAFLFSVGAPSEAIPLGVQARAIAWVDSPELGTSPISESGGYRRISMGLLAGPKEESLMDARVRAPAISTMPHRGRRSWPCASSRAQSGGRIFPGFTAHTVEAQIKDVVGKIDIRGAPCSRRADTEWGRSRIQRKGATAALRSYSLGLAIPGVYGESRPRQFRREGHAQSPD